jgi:hypothetical protein
VVDVADNYFTAVLADPADELYALIDPAAYTPVRLTCKETRARAWLWLPAESRQRD